MPEESTQSGFWFLLLFAAVGGLVAGCPSLRFAIRDGFRCLQSESVLWRLPILFVVVYAIYQWVAEALYRWRTDEPVDSLWAWSFDFTGWVSEFSYPQLAMAVGNTASLFDSLVTVYPVSALFGLAYLFDFRGLRSEFSQVVGKRFPSVGWLVVSGFLIAAIAAFLRPAIHLFLPEMEGILPGFLAWGLPVFMVLAFAFEFAAAVALQTFLIVNVFLWSRGIRSSRGRVYRLTAHRFGFVVKFALAVYGVFLLLVMLGAVYETARALAGGNGATFDPLLWLSVYGMQLNGILLLLLILLCTVQVRLAIHNRSLRSAIGEHFRFLRSHFGTLLAFLLFATIAFYLLTFAAGTLLYGLSQAGRGWSELAVLAKNMLGAAMGGWLLACWVLLYRRLEGGYRELLY